MAKLRRLYESDHKRAAASAFAVDTATTTALEGLLVNPDPLTDDRSTFLIDQLLLHADPHIFDGDHPSTSASRAALIASTRAPPPRSVSSSSAEIVEVQPGSPMVVQPATPSHGGSDDGEDEIDEERDSGKRRADSDYPSSDDSDSDDNAGVPGLGAVAPSYVSFSVCMARRGICPRIAPFVCLFWYYL